MWLRLRSMLIGLRIGSPPAKKPKPLLLRAPDAEDEISETNRFTYKPKGSYAHSHSNSDSHIQADEEESMPPSASQESMATTSVSGDGSELEEEEDDFARMVSDSHRQMITCHLYDHGLRMLITIVTRGTRRVIYSSTVGQCRYEVPCDSCYAMPLQYASSTSRHGTTRLPSVRVLRYKVPSTQ